MKVGVLKSKRDEKGNLIDDDPSRFAFHNLRHSLASFLVRTGTDVKTVQNLLRHSSSKVTIDWYLHSVSEDRMAEQGKMLEAILIQKNGGQGRNRTADASLFRAGAVHT